MDILLLLMTLHVIYKQSGNAITESSGPVKNLIPFSSIEGVKNRIRNIIRKKQILPCEGDPELKNEVLRLIALHDIMERPKKVNWLKSTIFFLENLKDVNPRFKEDEIKKCMDDILKIGEEDEINKCYLARQLGYDFTKLPQLFNDLDDLNKLENAYARLNICPQYVEKEIKSLSRIIEALQMKELNMKDLNLLLGDTKSIQDLKKSIQYIPRATIRIRMLTGLEKFKPEDLDELPQEINSMEGFDIISTIAERAESRFKADITKNLQKMSVPCRMRQEAQ